MHVELRKQLTQGGSEYDLHMAYIVEAATKAEAKTKGEIAARAENPACRAKAYHAEELK